MKVAIEAVFIFSIVAAAFCTLMFVWMISLGGLASFVIFQAGLTAVQWGNVVFVYRKLAKRQ